MASSKEEYAGLKKADKPSKLRTVYFSDDASHRSTHKADFTPTEYDINNKLNEANLKLAKIEEKVKSVEKDTKIKIDQQLVEVRQQIDESKSRVVETLALFAALFTFLSLQVQIFKDQKDVDQVIGLVLITGGLITFFVLILDLMVKNKEDAKNFLRLRFFLLLSISVLLIISGIMIMKLDY